MNHHGSTLELLELHTVRHRQAAKPLRFYDEQRRKAVVVVVSWLKSLSAAAAALLLFQVVTKAKAFS